MSDLYTKTMNLLATTKTPLIKVAIESQVGYRWICKLIAGEFSDPGVNRIQRVHDYLIKEQEENNQNDSFRSAA